MSIKSYTKKNKAGFYSDAFKVEFSDSYIQGWDEDAYCKNQNDILYYYYFLNVFRKDESSEKWKKFFNVYIHDFPAILNFKELLEYFINDKIEVDRYQKDVVENRTYYSYCTDRHSSFAEDFYTISHSFCIDEENERCQDFYDIDVGGWNPPYYGSVMNVRFTSLDKEDLKTIYNTIVSFINISIKKHNELIVKRNKTSLNSWLVTEGKLYQTKKDSMEIMEAVYCVGDKIEEAIVLVGDINSQDFHATVFNDFVIDEVTKDYIVISTGFEASRRSRDTREINSEEKIYLNTLLAIYDEVSEEKLNYGEEEIKEDFINILSENEKKEFIEKDIDFLCEKYEDVILNRTWMCRSEHNLPQRVKDLGNHENVYESIKIIIENIKKELSDNV